MIPNIKDIPALDKNELIRAKNDVAAQLAQRAAELSALNTQIKEKMSEPISVKSLSEIDLLQSKSKELSADRKSLESVRGSIDSALDEYKLVKKNISLSNIRYLLKSHPDIKLGQIEAEGGVSTGYTSRLEKADNKSDPPIEYIAAAAKAFDIFIDTLLYSPLEEMTPTERYLMKFIEKIAKDTMEDKLIWEREPCDNLNTYVGESPVKRHVLFVPDKNNLDNYGNPQSFYFKSRFFPEKPVDVTADPYHANLPNSANVLYILPIYLYDDEECDDGNSAYEIYIWDEDEVIPICNTLQANTEIKNAISKLFSVIQETAAHVRLDERARWIIDSYMNPQKLSDPLAGLVGGEMPF